MGSSSSSRKIKSSATVMMSRMRASSSKTSKASTLRRGRCRWRSTDRRGCSGWGLEAGVRRSGLSFAGLCELGILESLSVLVEIPALTASAPAKG